MTNSEAAQHEKGIEGAVAEGDLTRAEALAAEYCQAAVMAEGQGDFACSPRFRAAYLAGQVALAAGRLRRAAEHLAPLLPEASRLPEKLAARLRLFAAEAQARLNEEAQARALLARVSGALLDREPLLHLRALRIRLWLGEIASLGEELARCDQALKVHGEAANRALLACEEGRAWDRAGDLSRARACWERAEQLVLPTPGPDAIRADVLVQLARLDHLRGRIGPALARYEAARCSALPGAQTLEIELRRLLVRLDLHPWEEVRAAAESLLGRTDLATLPEEIRPLAGMVRGLFGGTPPADASDETLAFLAAAKGDTAFARSLYLRAFAANPSSERRARLALALGLLALGHSDLVEARSWIGQAEGLARERSLPDVLIRALLVSGQMAAEQQGDDETARRFFEEAVLLAEAQAADFRHVAEGHHYRQRQGSALRFLLRSACRRGDVRRAFQYQELERGRLLLDLLQLAGRRTAGLSLFDRPDVAELIAAITAFDKELELSPSGPDGQDRRQSLLRRRAELLLQRDRKFEDFLHDRGRRGNAILPALPSLEALRRVLPPRSLYLAPALVGDELYLLAAGPDGPPRIVRASGSARSLGADLNNLRTALTTQLTRYRGGYSMGRARAELDDRLAALGRGPLGEAIVEAVAGQPTGPRRIVWAPEGPLHGIPVHAIRIAGRYLIEDLEFVWTFGGALFVHQDQTRRQRRGRFRPAVVIAEPPEVLPEAGREGEGVAASFLWSRSLPAGTTDRKELRRWLARARVAHFACHADFDSEHPLAAVVRLSSGATIHALEWLEEPVSGLPLVTLSACRSAEVASLIGREVFGLVTGLLGGGVRAVLAGLWPVADREVRPLMWRFYRHRLVHELPTALALTQRDALAAPDSSPLYWAPFALFGDAAGLPAPTLWGRWLARLRQRRHTHRFPTPHLDGDG
jgi:tetratricopeptide (TPR) repeat protein